MEEPAIKNSIVKKEPFGRNGGRKAGYMNKATAQAVGMIVNSGVDPEHALMIATGKDSVHPRAVRRIKDKVAKWSLKHPSALAGASKTIQAFAKGRDVNGIIPKDSTVLAAAQRIVDASDPVIKRSENLNISVDMHPVDLDKYLGQ